MSAFDTLMGTRGRPVLAAHLGRSIVHTAPGEDAATITAIVGEARSWVEQDDDGRVTVTECSVSIDSDDATPAHGDTLTFDDKDWIVTETTDQPGNVIEITARRTRVIEKTGRNYRVPR